MRPERATQPLWLFASWTLPGHVPDNKMRDTLFSVRAVLRGTGQHAAVLISFGLV